MRFIIITCLLFISVIGLAQEDKSASKQSENKPESAQEDKSVPKPIKKRKISADLSEFKFNSDSIAFKVSLPYDGMIEVRVLDDKKQMLCQELHFPKRTPKETKGKKKTSQEDPNITFTLDKIFKDCRDTRQKTSLEPGKYYLEVTYKGKATLKEFTIKG